MFRTAKHFPAWAAISLATNGILLVTIAVLLWRDRPDWSPSAQANASVTETPLSETALGETLVPAATPTPKPTPTTKAADGQQLDYEDWVEILEKEADAVAANPPERLYILAGDSISLWFPNELLPPDVTWLNQGISGEGSEGLYKRLPALDETRPKKIFIMIGINDLLRGVSEDTIAENHRQIIKDIRWIHPNTEVIVQSILPHSGDQATWEGRDKLKDIPNDRIRRLNRRLQAIAEAEGAIYLDLYPLFADENGALRTEFSTDGLHLNERGYQIWRTALMVFEAQRSPDSELGN